MTTRDRLVLVAIAVIAVLAAGWVIVVQPERNKASTLATQVSTARTELSSAESQLAQARSAQQRYSQAYASIVSLGKAVPAGEEVPSLIYEVDQASGTKHVQFESISAGGAASGGASTGSLAAAAAAASAFQLLPFTFTFSGNFVDLYHLFGRFNALDMHTPSGELVVNGRLLTIQSVNLTPASVSASGKGGSSAGQLTGTVTATAYVLPVSQGLTGGATPSGPTGSTAQPASSAASSGAPATAAVVEARP